MLRRRCLFPADRFYEWKAGLGRKRPFCIRPRNGQPVAFAGLWETWIGPNGEEVDTACIVTTAANRLLAPIHDRMPVVIAPEAFDLWLDCAHVGALTAAALIAPAPVSLFEVYEISTAINRAANDYPAVIGPLEAQPKLGRGNICCAAGRTVAHSGFFAHKSHCSGWYWLIPIMIAARASHHLPITPSQAIAAASRHA
jgi:hypothetical protein